MILRAGALLLLTVSFAGTALADASQERRLSQIRERIVRLEAELERLRRDERGLLGELERLSAEIQLRVAEQQKVALEVEGVETRIAEQSETLETLRVAQDERRDYLRFRLREQYKDGESRWLRRWLDDAGAAVSGDGLRYANFLSARDARILRDFRETAAEIERERLVLVEQQEELDRVSSELAAARRTLRAARRRHTARLDSIREDSERRETALAELRGAADALGEWVGGLRGGEADGSLAIRKFRGLLDWPGAGKVSAGFGTQIHPRFKTKVPHPGLDIEGGFGSPIRSVFEGEVVFAAWMRGYGLTTIVDHGDAVLSIYAHASALLVEKGETVEAGQRIGLVGDSGSLRGNYLYFEMRDGGRPVDPADWLRPRR